MNCDYLKNMNYCVLQRVHRRLQPPMDWRLLYSVRGGHLSSRLLHSGQRYLLWKVSMGVLLPQPFGHFSATFIPVLLRGTAQPSTVSLTDSKVSRRIDHLGRTISIYFIAEKENSKWSVDSGCLLDSRSSIFMQAKTEKIKFFCKPW